MKLTTEQQEFLKKYLRKNLSYRETYTEFYDHILSALEAKPQTMSFQDAIESVIAEDFGGYDGMTLIESRYKRAVTKEMQKKYLHYVMEYLKFPLIGVIAILTAVFYYITIQPWFGFMVFFGIILGTRLIPALLKGIRHFRLGYIFTDTKRSVKDGTFEWLDYIPGILFTLLLLCHISNQETPIEWFDRANPIGLALFLTSCALHSLAFYSVYKDEFKASITQ